MNIHIETDRLIVRDIENYDAEGMYKLDSDPDVHEFLGKKPVKTLQESREVIELIRKQYIEHGIGRWAMQHKETGDFIGWTGLKYETSLREFDYYDLGYRLRKEYWGQGLATESALASLEYGFTKMNLQSIGGAAETMHHASNRILQKIGLNLIDTFIYDDVLHNWYKIDRSDWSTDRGV